MFEWHTNKKQSLPAFTKNSLIGLSTFSFTIYNTNILPGALQKLSPLIKKQRKIQFRYEKKSDYFVFILLQQKQEDQYNQGEILFFGRTESKRVLSRYHSQKFFLKVFSFQK